MSAVARMVIVGGGPGGYEAALVAAQVGAEVTLVDRDGLGGSAVLTDVVPSKALITVADVMDEVFDSRRLGVRFDGDVERRPRRCQRAAQDRSPPRSRPTSRRTCARTASRLCVASDAWTGPIVSWPTLADGSAASRWTPTPCLWPPALTRVEIETARPDGERILSWTQLYDIDELPPST